MLNKQHTKYIGIDYGKKRTGISISDHNKVISFPLDTIDTKKLMIYLEGLIPNEKIEKVIIGKPLKLNNQVHELENDIIKFIKSLKSIFPNIIIERVDERYTSKISNLIIRQSGIKQKSRMNKSIIDKISASLILESYLTMINK
ncbi:MAG: Holliday junction resolvase RuvX [Cryomorphaceae bacterium]|nr:Holliday junction resolvase RuvX [Cryomorphaceae bacterium]MDG1889003.1 Holliday junction resolvase RuvX [Flavobacteriaceae bacterium]MBT3503701.1 Holliday junction resolvase RuvX [Cryomorphaceae bacterium]MBT3689711.1 Holliday junction resolvase RuvX [Cryomorphaceae bacterium]MBT4222702.1 Holliday junction resolvase RuvX [Cryomorphaceae bacterium]